MSDAELERLAQRAGIAVHWHDYRGQPQRVAPDSLRALLAALGYPAGDPAELRDSEAALQSGAHAARPLVTADPGGRVQCPGLAAGERVRIAGAEGATEALVQDDGAPLLAAPGAPGWYRVEGAGHAFTLAVAPPRCTSVADLCGADARPFGIAAQIYSLSEPGDMGLASYAGLARFAEAAAAQGADALAVSPTHAMFSADPARRSPYGPSSRLFLNALHIDAELAAGTAAVAAAQAGLGTAAAARHLEAAALIDWGTAGSLRLGLLQALAPTLLADASLLRAFERYRAAQGEALEAHARFEMLHARLGGSGWRDWPAAFHDPAGAEVQRLAEQHAEEVRFHALLQFLACRQRAQAQQRACAAGMRIGLVADLAIGVDGGGSQAWARQAEMLAGVSVGAPPDLLAPEGQGWGIAAFSPTALCRSGFHAFIELLDACMAHSGGLRVDHVMGLQRLWLIPQGGSSADGAYVSYPQDDLLRLLRLASWRRRCLVVGEDLGTVDPALRERLARAGALGMSVLWFERDGHRFTPPPQWRRSSVAMSSTHDLPTLAGWWEGRDLALRASLRPPDPAGQAAAQAARAADREALWQAMAEAGHADGAAPAADDVHGRTRFVDAALAHTASAASVLALLPLEDVLATPDAPNLPGTVDEHPNWRRRLPSPTSAELGQPAVAARLRRVCAARSDG